MSAAAPGLCRVCRQRAAEYTCPRCNARYCSLDCYKRHSDRCTEGFYREAAVSELRSITAGEDEKRRMLDILQRLHQQDLEGGGSGGSSDEEEPGGSGDEGGLSAETLHRLLAKMQASEGGSADISAEDLSPAELVAFHRALAAGELSGAVQPWEPWWLSEEAARLQLSAGGTHLVAAVEQAAAGGEQPRGGGTEQQAAGSSSSQSAPGQPAAPSSSGGLPPPPSRPLPPLAALTKAPSPLLRYQLLDLLYCYCFVLRLFNGDYSCDAAEAADTLFALSAVLAAAPPAAGSNSSGSGGSGTDAAAVPVLLGCVQRACQPPVGSRDDRHFAVGVLSDVAAVLQLGRPVVVTALMDASRLVEAARQQLEGGEAGGGAKQARELRRRLVAAERKLLFFLSWANEPGGEAFELLALAAAGEHQKHAATLGGAQPQGAGAGLAAQLGAAAGGGSAPQRAGQQQARSVGQAGAPAALIEEL